MDKGLCNQTRGDGARERKPRRLPRAPSAGFLLCLLLAAPGCGRRAKLENAQTAWDNGDYAQAAETYEQFLRDNPSREQAAIARYQAATIYRRDLKQCDKAIPHYIELIVNFPTSPDVYNARMNLADCYGKTDKLREAIAEYENLLPFTSEEKEKRRVRTQIAELYYKLNDYGQAIAEYQKVTENAAYDDLSELAWLQLAGIRLLRDEYDTAIPAYQTVAANTQEADIRRLARYRLADCYERTFQYDHAVKTLEESGPDPKSPNYLQERIAKIRENQRQRSVPSPSSLGGLKRR
jgi:tetratricopeptide (TPR) repeat protein